MGMIAWGKSAVYLSILATTAKAIVQFLLHVMLSCFLREEKEHFETYEKWEKCHHTKVGIPEQLNTTSIL